MNRPVALLTAVGVLAAGIVSAAALGAKLETSSRTVTVQSGDVIRVAGSANVGCKVRPRDGVETLDCRRAGPLAGTYGAMLNKKELLAVRFESSRVAKIVLVARHGNRKLTRCR
jgi:hypothetical protein